MKVTGVGYRPPGFQTDLSTCIADFMGGYYGLFGTEMSTSEPDRRDLLINVVHGDKPEEVLAEKRFRLPTIGEIAQPGDNTIDDPLNGGPAWEEYRGFSAAATVRPGVVAFGVQAVSSSRAALSTFHWDGRDVTMGRHIPVIDREYADPRAYGHDEGYYTVGGYDMVFPGLTPPPGSDLATISSQVILFAYKGRVLAFNPHKVAYLSPAENVAALRWYRIDAGGLVPDGGWVYKRSLKAAYWHGRSGSAAGMAGRFAYTLSSRWDGDSLWMMRIDMDTLALSEVKVFDPKPPSGPPNALNLTPRGVELALQDGQQVVTVTPDLKVTTRSVEREYERLKEKSGYGWLSGISPQNLAQTSTLVMRPSAITSAYLPPAPPLSYPDEGIMFYSSDGKEHAAWINGEQIGSLAGGSQLYIGTTHAIRTYFGPDDSRATFVRLPDVGNLAPGEHSARGFFT